MKRREQVFALYLAGMTKSEIARQLGVSTRTVYVDLEALEDSRVKVEDIIEDAGIDAHDIHILASRMADMDLADIAENPTEPITSLRYKPLSQWPAIWRQVATLKVKKKPLNVRSNDGEQKGDSKSWDQVGVEYEVEVVRPEIMKILELSAKLKSVDALAAQKQDVDIHVHGQITAKLQAALARESRAIEGGIVELKPE